MYGECNTGEVGGFRIFFSRTQWYPDFPAQFSLFSRLSHSADDIIIISSGPRKKQTPDVRFQMDEQWKRRSSVMPVLLHGDASMFQGSVRETFGLTNLKDCAAGGTVHIVINNQIGFTTSPKEADSAVHCTDVAKITGT